MLYPMQVDERLAGLGRKNDAIARDVLSAWELAEPGVSKPNARSIGTKLGELRRGRSKWWRGQPGALMALAQILGCRPEDLVEPEQATGIRFKDFPELRPLGLNEDPCELGLRLNGGLLSPLGKAFRSGVPTWMVIPPGWGKRLTVDVLTRSGVAGGCYETCLEAARDAAIPRGTPAVFAIAWPDSDPAMFALAAHELAVRRAVVVFAAFEPPRPDEWAVVEPSPREHWRGDFVRWCAARITSGSLDVDACLDWLEHVDADVELADSPGALLPLLAWIHRHGPPIDSDRVRIARAYLAERKIDPPYDLVRDELDRRVEAHPDRTLAELSEAFGRTRIDAMRQHGVLVCDDGSPTLHPGWVFEWFTLEMLRGVGVSEWSVWGRWAAHPDLHDDIVDALVDFEKADLLRNVAVVLGDSTDSLARAGAVEALFEAVGARFAEEREQPPLKLKAADRELLRQLACEQLRLVRRVEQTRAGRPFRFTAVVESADVDAASMKWLSRAWSFSLAMAGTIEDRGMAAWAMPAWASADALRRMGPVPPIPSLASLDPLAEACLLVRAARRLVQSVPQLAELSEWPIQVAALLEGCAFEAPLLDGFVEGYVADVLESSLAAEHEDVRARVATSVWNKLCELDGYPIAALDTIRRDSALERILKAWLPGDEFARPFDGAMLVASVQKRRHGLSRYPVRLREPLIRKIAEALVARPPVERDDFTLQLELDDLEHFDTLASLASTRWQGAAAAKRAWQLDPDRALTALRSALAANDAFVGHWVGSAPLEESHRVAETLLAVRPAPSSSVRRWLSERAGAGGRDATRLYALLVQLDQAESDIDAGGE